MWVDQAVDKLLSDNPEKDFFTCAAGISPSGSVHLGNLREFLTSFFVSVGIKRRGKQSRFYLSWDDFDRIRKIPLNIKNIVGDSFDKYIGMPYVDAPDPFGCHENYARHFQAEFEETVKAMGIDVEYIYQADCYRAGRYTENIIHAMKNRKFIYDVLYEYKSQEATEESREKYVPINVYCRKCGHDSTVVTHVSDDAETITYTCKACGHTETVSLREYFNVKLVWKVDWPMRWSVENVDFEPGGKDHGTEGSSYTVGKVYSKELYNKTAPDFVMYEFIGIKGLAGKMGSSTGLNFTPKEALKVYPPEMLLWLYAKTDARQAWNFCLDEETLRLYHEFDRMQEALSKETCPQNIKDIMYYALSTTKNNHVNKVSAQLLASLGSIVGFDKKLTYDLFKKIDPEVSKDDLDERIDKIKYLFENYMPDEKTELLKEKNIEYFNSLSDDEKKDIISLHTSLLNNNYSLESLQTLLYDTCKRDNDDKKQTMEKQKRFFENVYMLLTGKSAGPRLYLFLGALNLDSYIELLNF